MLANCRSAYDNVLETRVAKKDRPFDLEVGDIVKSNRLVDKDSNRYKVTAIYDRLFMTETKTGYKTSFTKLEYTRGELVLVRKAHHDGSWDYE